jgi:four helix bundle protein
LKAVYQGQKDKWKMDKPHKKLNVWQLSMKLATEIYKITKLFPSEERFGLTQQMRRASVSIPRNIAEGAARQGKKEFRNFLSVAQGSLSELDTQLELSVLLGFLEENKYGEISNPMVMIDKMLTSLIRSLSKSSERGK